MLAAGGPAGSRSGQGHCPAIEDTAARAEIASGRRGGATSPGRLRPELRRTRAAQQLVHRTQRGRQGIELWCLPLILVHLRRACAHPKFHFPSRLRGCLNVERTQLRLDRTLVAGGVSNRQSPGRLTTIPGSGTPGRSGDWASDRNLVMMGNLGLCRFLGGYDAALGRRPDGSWVLSHKE